MGRLKEMDGAHTSQVSVCSLLNEIQESHLFAFALSLLIFPYLRSYGLSIYLCLVFLAMILCSSVHIPLAPLWCSNGKCDYARLCLPGGFTFSTVALSGQHTHKGYIFMCVCVSVSESKCMCVCVCALWRRLWWGGFAVNTFHLLLQEASWARHTEMKPL